MSEKEAKVDKQSVSGFWGPWAAILLTVGLFFAAQFFASFFFIFLSLGAGWDDYQLNQWFEKSALPQFIYIALSDLLIVGGIYWLLKKKRQGFKFLGVARPRLSDFGRALIAYGCYIVMFIIISAVAKAIAPSLNLEQEQQLGFEANRGVINLVLAGISLVLLPPIVEELLCRGFLYTSLRLRWKIAYSAVVTSIIFAVAHLQFGSGAPLLWVAAIDTFVLSLVLVYLRETTGRLTASIFLHMIKNAVAFSILFIFVS